MSNIMSEVVSLQNQKDPIVRMFKIVFLLMCSTVAIMIEPGKLDLARGENGLLGFVTLLRSEMGTVDAVHVIAVGALWVLFDRQLFRKEKPFCLTACIIGAVFSAFLMIGFSFSSFHNFDFIFGNLQQLLIALWVFLGFWAVLYTVLKTMYIGLDTLSYRRCVYEGILKIISEHFFLFSFAVMLLIWLLLGLSYFPGSVPHDGRNQLNMVYGFADWFIHHPFYSTVILGAVYGLGHELFGVMGGCVFYVVFQSVLAGFVFSRICDYIYKKTKKLLPALLCLLYFAVSPMWWTAMQTVIKDTLYTIAFALFVFEYVKVFLKDGNRWDIIFLIASAIGVCSLRNGGHFIVLPALLALMIAVVDRRKLMCVVFVIVALADYCLNTVVIDHLGLTPVNQVEALSIPLQQIARYVTYYEDELTEEEKSIIDCVVKYDGISERYNPELSDPIKNKYRNTTEEEWDAFWNLWFEKLLEHPGVYITATMNHVFGYIDPFYVYDGMSKYQLYNKGSISNRDTDVVYSKYLMSQEVRTAAEDAAKIWNNIPFLSFIVSPAFCTWVGIFLIGALLRKKKWRAALLFVAPLMSVLICFASPVNGLLRYALPVMAAIPPLILLGVQPYLHRNEIPEIPQSS